MAISSSIALRPIRSLLEKWKDLCVASSPLISFMKNQFLNSSPFSNIGGEISSGPNCGIPSFKVTAISYFVVGVVVGVEDVAVSGCVVCLLSPLTQRTAMTLLMKCELMAIGLKEASFPSRNTILKREIQCRESNKKGKIQTNEHYIISQMPFSFYLLRILGGIER